MPIIWFIANCGGILGLCMGFSLITIFEIGQYALQIFCNNLRIKASVWCPNCCQKERHQSRADVETENNTVQIGENGHKNGILENEMNDLAENETGQTTSTPNRAGHSVPIVTY